ncbi:MAG: peptidase T [Spirochaetes bacterium]|nr:peptidase T [Spirochaetota bacterium]
METVLDKFIRYAKMDTASDDSSSTVPSTRKQFRLAELLRDEMTALGLNNIHLDEKCYLYAELPANSDADVPVMGLIAHMDTSPDFTAENVNPRIINNYDGKDIVLNKAENIVMKTADFPELESYKGQTLITTDGNTLLGADDKAGVAEILSAVEYLYCHPEIKHGKVKICFTPDEEVGRGADHFDVKSFGADFAFTVDGGRIGELEFENFNAAKATVFFKGRNVHPGEAKNKMINAMEHAIAFNGMLPVSEKPEHTSGYEGFYHLISMNGTVEHAELKYIIRDHDMTKFLAKKDRISRICEFINRDTGREIASAVIEDQYYNMREKIEPVYHIIKIAEKAMIDCGVKPLIKPIRGGTDGSKLSYIGLPCPNVFTGGHNYHGRFEYVVLESMKKAVEVIVRICELAADDMPAA